MAEQKIQRSISIGVKIIVLSAVFAAVFLGASYGYALIEMRKELSKANVAVLEDEVTLGANQIESSIEEYKSTVSAIVETPPFQGIIRAEKNDGFDQLEDSTSEQWKKRMASIFVAEMKARSVYDQFRYLDEDGNEIVRVNKTSTGEFVVPESELQYKGNRDYFTETMALQDGELYVSQVTLNREGITQQIETPYKPVLRIATPVFDRQTSERKGVFIANILFDEIIAVDEVVPRVRANVYIINSEGYYLLHPDEAKRWGGPQDIDTGENFYNDFSTLSPKSFLYEYDSIETENSIFSYAIVKPDSSNEERSWTVLANISKDIIYEPVDSITTRAILLGFGTYCVLFIIFLYVVRRLLAPLDKLTLFAESIGRGDFSATVDIHSNDEIGQLARSFRTMQAQLSDLYKKLELKVKQRTLELEKRTQLLEQSELKLKEKLDETARLNKLMVNRELKMIELKNELEKVGGAKKQ